MRKEPEEIERERRSSRQNLIQPGERIAAELARIADTLESIRRELVALVDASRPSA